MRAFAPFFLGGLCLGADPQLHLDSAKILGCTGSTTEVACPSADTLEGVHACVDANYEKCKAGHLEVSLKADRIAQECASDDALRAFVIDPVFAQLQHALPTLMLAATGVKVIKFKGTRNNCYADSVLYAYGGEASVACETPQVGGFPLARERSDVKEFIFATPKSIEEMRNVVGMTVNNCYLEYDMQDDVEVLMYAESPMSNFAPPTSPPTTETPSTTPPTTASTLTTIEVTTEAPSTTPPTTASTLTTIEATTEAPSTTTPTTISTLTTTRSTITEEPPADEEEAFGSREQSTIAIIGALGGFVALAGGAGYYMWNSLPTVADGEPSEFVSDSNQMPHENREQFLESGLSF